MAGLPAKSDMNIMAIAPFSALYTFFDAAVISVITNGTANMITLISPLMAAGFGIYMMLILSSYWREETLAEPILDFFFRMIGWAAVITFGLNIAIYQLYVVPFVNGLGDDLAGVVGNKYNSAAALDTMLGSFITAFTQLFNNASGIEETAFAIFAIGSMSILGGIFMVIAISYIILAKLALGILIAIGPLFISAALFPATREFFRNWTAQCLNYAFLVMLFSFTAQIEIAMISGLVPTDLSLSALFMMNLSCGVLIFVSLNLPSLASALAGGVGISSMVRKIPGLPKFPNKTPKGGGDITPASPPKQGGSVTPEQQ